MAEAALPVSATHVVVGGGVHGLSVASALARRLARNGSRSEVVLIERSKLGSGASGIAGGIVRCYYRSPAITEIVRLSVERFERSPEAFGFRQVGFLAVVPDHQVEDLRAIADRQAEVGYASELVTGNDPCAEYLTWLWPDFDARGVEAVLHERRSGWADASATLRELAREARDAGVTIVEETPVVDLENSGRSVSAVLTSRGVIRCEHVVFACGAWARDVWAMLGRAFDVTIGDTSPPLVDLVKDGQRLEVAIGEGTTGATVAPFPLYDTEKRRPRS